MDIQKMYLHEAVDSIVPGISAYDFGKGDVVGGYHSNAAESKWPVGAIWQIEGEFLQILVCHFQPRNILELGTGRGAGSAHLAAAVEQNGTSAKIVSVDNGTLGFEPRKTIGVEYVTADALAYLAGQDDDSIDFIFEDLDHHAETVRDVAMLALQKLAPGGILVSHDAAHWVVGEAVRRGYEQAGLEPLVFLMPPSDCGVSFWQKPGKREIVEPEPDYEAMTVPELKALLEERGAEDIPARAKKQEYIDRLKGER